MDDVERELAKQIDNNGALLKVIEKLEAKEKQLRKAMEHIERVLTLNGVHSFPEARTVAREALKDND